MIEPIDSPLPPLRAVTYLVVLREQNPRILNEFLHSFWSLRRFHPDLPVLVYHENAGPRELDHVRRLPGVMTFPIAVDRSGRYVANGFRTPAGGTFPELFVLASKIDVLLLTPGDTLFLDTDTEVRAPLDEVFASAAPWMHEYEGLMRDHDRDLRSLLESVNWRSMGWRGDPERLAMFNSGSIWVPQACKHHLYKAKEFLWSLVLTPAEERGDNRLDEQIALSAALHEATGYEMREVCPRVYHYWREKYEDAAPWYEERFPEGAAAEHASA